MSVPDGLVSIKDNLKVFTRESEYEVKPSFYDESEGVWLDSFKSEWINEDIINRHLSNNKNLHCIS